MKRSDAATKRTGQPRCMHRVEIATKLPPPGMSGSFGPSIFSLYARTYTVALPTSPIPGTTVITFGMYVSFGNSPGLPTASQRTGGRSNTAEPIAKPSAGSANVATAMPPAVWVGSDMARRRGTVSPLNAPGIRRSFVYLDAGGVRRGAGTEERNDIDPDAETGRYLSPRHAALVASWSAVGPLPTTRTPACQTAVARWGSPSACACAASEIT